MPATMLLLCCCSLWMAALPLAQTVERCRGGGAGLRHVWGDALTDSPDCVGPNGEPYPT